MLICNVASGGSILSHYISACILRGFLRIPISAAAHRTAAVRLDIHQLACTRGIPVLAGGPETSKATYLIKLMRFPHCSHQPTTHPRIYRWRWGSALHKIGVNPFASKYLTTHCENLCCLSNHQLLARFCTAKFNFPEKLQFDEYKLENEEQLLQHCTFHAQMIMMQLLHLPRLRMCIDGVPPRDTFNVHLYSSFVTAAATAATNKLHSPYAK